MATLEAEFILACTLDVLYGEGRRLEDYILAIWTRTVFDFFVFFDVIHTEVLFVEIEEVLVLFVIEEVYYKGVPYY